MPQPAFSAARLGYEIPSIHVGELAQAVQERVGGWAPRFGPDHVGGYPRETENSDARDLARGLRPGDARHREGTEGEAADESAPVHHSVTQGRLEQRPDLLVPRVARLFPAPPAAQEQ